MPEDIKLHAQPRTVIGKQVRALRRSGWIPLSLYGRHIDPVSLQVEERALRPILGQAAHNRLIRLDFDGGEPRRVVIREIQREPISTRILHIDLLEISMTEKMTVEVPLVLTGTSPVVSRSEGLLIHGITQITVRVLPGDLISEIPVDVSVINAVDQTLYVRDLQVSDKLEVLTPADEMVVKAIALKEEKIEEVVAPVAAAQVEVIGKGKKEEEAEEGAAPEAKT